MCDCSDLIGRPYRLGADGSDREIDCIHLVYTVLDRLGVPTPEFQSGWYTADARTVLRDIQQWGHRVAQPQYDGDVLLLRQSGWGFAVVWQDGILYINGELQRVAWSPLCAVQNCRCYRMKSS